MNLLQILVEVHFPVAYQHDPELRGEQRNQRKAELHCML